ncbi:hypothetical protein PFISCL1PPCAC_14095, partial [Pristionchus fissidentatus]
PIEDVVITAVLVVYGTLLSFGALMCLVFALALIRGRKWPFYSIVHHLLFLDTVYLLYQVMPCLKQRIVTSPRISPLTTLISYQTRRFQAWYNTKYVRAAFSMLDCIPLKGLIYLTLLMTINRMAVFVIPALRPIFTKPKITWSLLVCWLFILLLCFLSVLVRPTQKFNRTSLRFEDIGEPIVKAPALRDIIAVVDYAVPFVILFMYLIIWLVIRKKRRISRRMSNSHENNGDDNRILLEAVVIALFLQLYNISTIATTFVTDDGTLGYALSMTSLILSVTNHSIHSTIFIFTNSTIRGLLPRRCSRTKIYPLSVTRVFMYAYGVILVAGTLMTLVFLVALMRGRKMIGQWPFYKIVWSMTWMDAIYLIISVS